MRDAGVEEVEDDGDLLSGVVFVVLEDVVRDELFRLLHQMTSLVAVDFHVY